MTTLAILLMAGFLGLWLIGRAMRPPPPRRHRQYPFGSYERTWENLTRRPYDDR